MRTRCDDQLPRFQTYTTNNPLPRRKEENRRHRKALSQQVPTHASLHLPRAGCSTREKSARSTRPKTVCTLGTNRRGSTPCATAPQSQHGSRARVSLCGRGSHHAFRLRWHGEGERGKQDINITKRQQDHSFALWSWGAEQEPESREPSKPSALTSRRTGQRTPAQPAGAPSSPGCSRSWTCPCHPSRSACTAA